MYVFPGIGLGSILCKAAHISPEMIYTSAVALSTTIKNSEIEAGMLYPEITRIREVSVVVAREVIRQAQKEDLDREKLLRELSDAELDSWIKTQMYDPTVMDGLLDLNAKEKLPGGKSML